MNPLIAATMMPGMPGMPSGGGGLSLSDTGSAVAGDIKNKINNGGAIHFAPSWQNNLIWLGAAGLAVAALYLWKK